MGNANLEEIYLIKIHTVLARIFEYHYSIQTGVEKDINQASYVHMMNDAKACLSKFSSRSQLRISGK